MIPMLLGAHKGFAYLILLATSLSFLVALIGALTGAPKALVKADRVLTRGVSTALGGLLFLLGVGLWFGRVPFTQIYPWVGVLTVVLQGVLVGRGIKPNLTALAAGEGSRGRWVVLSFAHSALMMVSFIAMTARW